MKNEMTELNLVELATKYGDADKARELLESLRWPNGPICPHCKSNRAYRLTPKADSARPGRKGLCKCKDCRKQFTVTVGTVFADSHIPLGKWLMAVYLLCSSKKAMSAHQLHRMLGITYKSAWFMAHRIRFAMTEGPLADLLKGTVEVDETYIGGKTKGMGRRYTGNKTPVVALVQRDGKVRTRVMSCVTGNNLKRVLKENVDTSATIMTDDFRAYRKATKEFEAHKTVNHSAGE